MRELHELQARRYLATEANAQFVYAATEMTFRMILQLAYNFCGQIRNAPALRIRAESSAPRPYWLPHKNKKAGPPDLKAIWCALHEALGGLRFSSRVLLSAGERTEADDAKSAQAHRRAQ